MSLTLLYQPTLTTIDTLWLDASLKEDHDLEVDVTDHPVETGASVSDHARPKPREVTIEGVVSNTPLSTLQARQAQTAEGTSILSTAGQPAVRGKPGWAESAFATLEALWTVPKLITIVTGLKTYDNMLLTSLKVPRDDKTGDVLKFTAKFKQVRLVKNATSVVATKKSGAKGKKNAGAVASTTVATPVPSYTSVALNTALASNAAAQAQAAKLAVGSAPGGGVF